jgi:plasmid replication initiation protein
MGLSENQYATFKSLNQKVIKEAIGEINSLSELRLKATFFKTNRSVSSLQFTITIEPNSKTMIQDKPMIKCELHHTLTEGFELSEKQAHYIINSYPKPYIYESLDIIKRKRREGTVKNLAAYTYQTIKNDYTPPTTKPKLSRGVQPTSKSAQQDQEDQQV